MVALWGQTPDQLELWVAQEVQRGTVVTGNLIEGTVEPQVCLARTWDQLIRRLRLDRRRAISVRSAQDLPLFLARWQGLVHPDRNPGDLRIRVAPLLGLPLDAELWESAVLPSRVTPYHPTEFDRLFIEGGLRWFGSGPQ
ncbi:MAG TPA: hypothetical protein VMB23_01625, partial [Spirochaetia bacterium]|nr:hypothetical protein [Spirochaetia bacterium]